MCTGGGSSTTTVQKSDPLPTSVTDASTSTASAEQQANEKQRKKRGVSSNYLSSDRGTILGGLADSSGSSANANAGRQTLG